MRDMQMEISEIVCDLFLLKTFSNNNQMKESVILCTSFFIFLLPNSLK